MFHLILAAAVSFPLEWNARFRTDVPYEVEVSPAKVGAASFVVKADGAALDTETLAGKAPGTVRLRFSVPKGAKTLECEGREGKVAVRPARENLFADALRPENVGKWKCEKGVKAKAVSDGVLLTADATAPIRAVATYTVSLPKGIGGKGAWQEITATSHARLVRGGELWIEQLDANGKELPETLADARWTSHMRPYEKTAVYRDEGRFHPDAVALRLRVELRRLDTAYDEFGRPVADKTDLLPNMTISHLAVRTAETLPFPKWNDSFFGKGVSGEGGDRSLRLGGKNGTALFYQTCSRGGWTQRHQYRDEKTRYFPRGEGTVEVWFKPASWDKGGNFTTLFQAYRGYNGYANPTDGLGDVLSLSYRAKDGALKLSVQDWKGRRMAKTWDAERFDFPVGVWTHVAVMWTPGGTADVYIGGKQRFTLPIAEFQAAPYDDPKVEVPNELWATEFFFGATAEAARIEEDYPKNSPVFDGEADLLRVSTGRRYSSDFTPPKLMTVDGDTRALFSFDCGFDGVSGGGFAFIPACIMAKTDRVDHRLATSGGVIQYYPVQNLPENDPDKVFNLVNYLVMPTDDEFRASRVSKTKSFTVKAGDRVSVDCGKVAYPDFVEISNRDGRKPLLYPIVVNKGNLDPRSYGDLANTLLAERKSDRENVNKVFQYAIAASDYFMNKTLDFPPESDFPRSACYEALIMLNGYCGFECGPLNNMTAQMLSTVAMCPASQTAGFGHSFEQVFYDGKNHIYDLSAQRFFPAMDNETAAYLKEVGDQPGIHRRMGRSADHFIRKSTRQLQVQDPSYGEKCALVLNPGETFRVWYANDGQMNNLHSQNRFGVSRRRAVNQMEALDYTEATGADSSKWWCLRIDRSFPHYSTGIITFDGKPTADNPAFSFSADSFNYNVSCCYPVVYAEYSAQLKDGRPAKLELSTDGGKTFRPLPVRKDGTATLEYRVKARHLYKVKVCAPIQSVRRFTARTEAQVNPRTYPGWIHGGENSLTFKCESDGPAKLSFGWRENAGKIEISGTARSGAIPGFERELAVVDPKAGLTLSVKGVSGKAKVRTFGRIAAKLTGGRLSLSYDRTKSAAYKHGVDNPETRGEFPAFAAVDIVDGDAVKTLTLIVSPNARLALADDPILKGRRRFSYDKLPAGEYNVFGLGRFEAHMKDRGAHTIRLVDPSAHGRLLAFVRPMNGAFDFLKAEYARPGERARWKWDTLMPSQKESGQASHSAWSMKSLTLPETDGLDVAVLADATAPVELAAVLVLPKGDLESHLETRNMLFGFNCDPFHVK